MRLAALFGVVAAVSASGQMSIDAPSLGVIADPVGGLIRPVLGLRVYPGLGAPRSLAEEAGRTLLSARGGYAVFETPTGWKLATLDGATVRNLEVPEGKVTTAALSPSGRSAIFHLEEPGRVHVITGLPLEPRQSFSASVSTPEVLSAAVNDAGNAALLGMRGDPGSIVALRNGALETVVPARAPVSIAFMPHSDRAVVADRQRNEVFSIELAESGSAVQVLANEEAGVRSPVDLALDDAAGRVLVLNAGSRTILDLSLRGEATRTVECSFEPARIAPLRDAGLYAVFSADRESRWLLRREPNGPQLGYLPAVE
jgi:hypothetical protein